MKLVTYSYKNSTSCGIFTENGIIDIPTSMDVDSAPRSVKQILQRGQSCLAEVAKLTETTKNFIDPAAVKLLAPIPRPGKLLALAGNYTKHIIEAGLKLGLSDSPQKTTVPRPFLMPSTVLTGPDTEIPWPCFSEQIDYELELAVVIGKTAKCVSPDRAIDHVAGYTIANDVSARSVTFNQNRADRPWDEFFDWINGKWADSFLPLGPWLVTADEIEDVQNLKMQLAVNDRIRQDANTSQMIFPVADIVSFISHLMTLEPGDIIATGTPHGVAMATGDFLKGGDKIQCRIENLGTMTNYLGQKPQQLYTPLKK